MSTRADPTLPDPAPPTTGEVLFSRYAYPPNSLGYCGPGDGAELLDVAAGIGREDVAAQARHFDGAWPYLEMIASSNHIDDPLDSRVVEAYWVGNELLDAVDPAFFAEAARGCFATQVGADWACLDPAHPRPTTPHHSFHVFAIYPWMNLLRRGQDRPALMVLDRCRIRWGQVIAVHGEHVEVDCQTLTWDGTSLGLGPVHPETVRFSDAGRSLSAAVSPGDCVSLHWDWMCDRLTPSQVGALTRFTTRQLEVTNRCR